MAYMDDSLWVAPSKTSLQEILTTANSFYKFARIKVNPSKSILATNSSSEDNYITFNEENIVAINRSKLFKYLGAWFSLTSNPIYTQKIIISEAYTCITKLQKSHITEKQAIYIINNVIMPRVSYRLNSSFLTHSQLLTLNRLNTNIVKQKARLSRGIPNSFLYHPEIYALKDIQQLQESHLSSTLLRNLNHPNFDSSFLKIRLQQIQDSTASNLSILSHSPLLPKKQKDTYTGQSILAIHSLHIQLLRNEDIKWPIPLNTKGTPINEVIANHSHAHLLKQQLNKHSIYYIEQFLSHNNTELLN